MPLSERSQCGTVNLERFLFADICCEPNGMPLTVFTLLARVGFDPWAEASRLAQIPNSEAVGCLELEINRVLSVYRTDSDGAELARSLVRQLPSQTPVKPVDVSFAGTGFDGIPMIAALMMFFGVMTFSLLTILLDH